ncbi:MAG: DUF1802 family protein [Cyanobacteria bacterium P01_D01_bin.156]
MSCSIRVLLTLRQDLKDADIPLPHQAFHLHKPATTKLALGWAVDCCPSLSVLLNQALKEWSVAIDALIQGQTVLLLRKGGIREVGKHFQVPYQQVWLYPTYEHQKPHLLKPAWADQIAPVNPGWHPTQVKLAAWANISHVWTVSTLEAVNALLPFHIWNEQFVAERFHWKPSQPLHLLLLKVHRLTSPIILDWQSTYGGCRSWLILQRTLDTEPSTPVLDDTLFSQTVQNIQTQLGDITISP